MLLIISAHIRAEIMRSFPGPIPRDHTCILLYLPGVSAHVPIPPARMDERMEGSRIVFPTLEKRSSEVWMPSEPGWPEIILHVYRRPPSEEGAKDRDSSMRSSIRHTR